MSNQPGYKPDHGDHDQAFTTLLQTAKKGNVKLNYDKLQYKQNEVEIFGKTYTTSGHKPSKDKVAAITSMASPTNKKQVQFFIGMTNHLTKIVWACRANQKTSQNIKYHSTWVLKINNPSYIWRKRLQVLLFLLITTPRSKLLCRQMPASKVLVLVYYKIQNQCILQASSYRCPERLCCNWVRITCSGFGQWRSSITFFMPVIFCLKQFRNVWSHIIQNL